MNMDTTPEAVPAERVDLWLWAVRRFKTRALAAAACRRGQIKVAGRPVKPSRLVRPGDRIEIEQPFLTVVLEMKAPLKQRVAAKLVPDFCQDLTPPEAIALADQMRSAVRSAPRRDPGMGRPTKKERRELDQLGNGGESPSA
ncbi:MAG: ribosome-associated heat shock protein Hsp15 [Verrucomicrobia bacterium]|jgi:ribosome-associated heat shock protein Hsp15|nr:MAG: ribosome-associated heat shock protein Hsp15 [Verrucomicrobiota bacterium]